MEDNYLFNNNEFFTQAELQQLKVILSQVISVEECHRNNELLDARVVKSRDPDTAKYFYKRAEKISKRIATLAKLQWKVKHKLLTLN